MDDIFVRYFQALSGSPVPSRPPGVPPGLGIHHYGTAKVVTKNWGEERWLAQGPFALKVIRVDPGQRTSLQYHEEKEEANFVLTGAGRLHYQDEQSRTIVSLAIERGTVVHVRPGVVHRIEAVTPLLLIEASTPQLDDVVRLEDDWGRPDGRVEAEHQT